MLKLKIWRQKINDGMTKGDMMESETLIRFIEEDSLFIKIK